METLTSSSFKEKVFDFEAAETWQFKGERPAIIDFYADWCGPCRAMAPVLGEISAEFSGRMDVYKVDTEADPELAAIFGVRAIPSLLFVPKEGPPTMAAGFMPKESLHDAIEEIFGIK